MRNLVFDIGGTTTRVALGDEKGLSAVEKAPTSQDPKEGVDLITGLAKELAAGLPIQAAAGGFPGVAVRGRLEGSPNLKAWEGFAFEEALSKAFDGISVAVRNDADMAALGEAVYGAGKGKRVVGYIGIGTGVGGGRIVNGNIDEGARGLEPGHQILDVQNLRDLESFVSGRAFSEKYGVHPKDVARSAYEEATPYLAVGMYNTILHWAPDVLVLGGSMVFGENGYSIEALIAALHKMPRKLLLVPEIKMAELKDSAGLHGARALLNSI